MKSRLIGVALLAASLSASAQTTEKTVSITKTSEVAYSVAPDGKTKDGLYYLKNLNNQGVWIRGSYKDNARAGTWYFFDAKENLTMRYSYDQKKLLYIDPKSLKNVTVHVLSDDQDVAKNASAPLPLCPVDYYANLIGNRIYTDNYDSTNDGLTAEITAHVDAAGKAVYTVAYIVKDKKTKETSIDMPPNFPIEWLPSTYKDKAIPSEFVIYAKLDKGAATDGQNMMRFNWNNEE